MGPGVLPDGADRFVSWQAVLDAIAEELAVLEQASPDEEAAPWTPPALAPLPPELAPRARDLLARVRVVERRIAAERRAVSGELDDLAARRAAAAHYR